MPSYESSETEYNYTKHVLIGQNLSEAETDRCCPKMCPDILFLDIPTPLSHYHHRIQSLTINNKTKREMMDGLYHKHQRRTCAATDGEDEVGVESKKSIYAVTVLSLAQGLGLEFVPLGALHFLDGPDIARCGSVNRFLYKAAVNEGVWQAARDRLWEGKVHVPPSAKMMTPKAGYIASLQDSKRTWLGLDELTSFSWWFRFKQQAGEAWTAQDPWYRNEKAPTVEFKDDHTVLRHGDMSLPPAASINWRFVPRTGLRTGPQGSFLRVSIGGREVPTYIVSRHSSNWGFLLESCWTLYTSWEMPPRDGPECDRSLLDDKLKVTMDDQWEEAMSFNTGLSFEIYDLAGLGGGGDADDDSLVDDVVDALVQAMGDEGGGDELQDAQHHYHVHGLGGGGGLQAGDNTMEQPGHGNMHHLINLPVSGSIPAARQDL